MSLSTVVGEHQRRREADKSNIMTLVFMPVKPNHPTRQHTDDLVVAMDLGSHRLLGFDNNATNGTFSLGLNLLKEHAQLELRYDLLDCNIDVCSREVLIHFSDNYDYADIRKDYVHNEVQNQEMGFKFHGYVIENEYAARVQDLRTYDSICRDVVRRWTHPLVPDSNIHGTTNFQLFGNGVFKEHGVKAQRSVRVRQRTTPARQHTSEAA
jgi:translation initiation factor eIF-2B subunit epsilon